MANNTTTIRVKKSTRKALQVYSSKYNLTMQDCVGKAINIAEKVGFDEEKALYSYQSIVSKEINRTIGFIRTQDKRLDKIIDLLENNISNNSEINSSNNKIDEERFSRLFIESCDKFNVNDDELNNVLLALDRTLNIY